METLALLILIAACASFAWLARHWWKRALQLEVERDAAIAHITTARGLAYDSGFARGERSMAGEMARAVVHAVREEQNVAAAVMRVARLADMPVAELEIPV